MSDPSTSQMEVEENVMKERDVEIIKLIEIIDMIVVELGDGKRQKIEADLKAGIIDIDLSDEMSGFLMTVFTCLRKEENDKPGHSRFLEYTAKIDGVDVSIKSVVEKMKAKKIEINFLICTPIVELITLFRSFYDETLIIARGHRSFTVYYLVSFAKTHLRQAY